MINRQVDSSILDMLHKPFRVSPEDIAFYRENRFIKIRDVLSSEIIAFFKSAVSHAVEEFSTHLVPLEQRDTYGKAFIQMMNIWQRNAVVKQLVFSKRIASIATQLMEVNGVRLYHDQALYKEPGGGITPWHADQYYWPLESDKTVTAWIPLQATPLEMGPLEFAAGSHRIVKGRDLQISDESENAISNNLRISDMPHIIEPFDLGEISFHSGWIFHRAGANTTSTTRKVMTIIYMDSEMRLIEPQNSNQVNDRDTWCPGAIPGNIIETPLNPVLFSRI